MNRSVNPCDDFWEHTCGNWISQTPIPPFAAVWNRFSLLTSKMNERIRGTAIHTVFSFIIIFFFPIKNITIKQIPQFF